MNKAWDFLQKKIPFLRKKPEQPRTIIIPITKQNKKFCSNKVENNRYTYLNYIPKCLFNQFKYFYNLYFLITALSQFVPILQVGYRFTYTMPLAFVVILAMAKDAYDDIRIRIRDKQTNSQPFTQLIGGEPKEIQSKDIVVGNILKLKKDERVPADCLILRSTEESGSIFIRTDQLDGETDWKLRRAIGETQKMDIQTICNSQFELNVEAPHADVYSFQGTIRINEDPKIYSLNVENTAWANTIVASDEMCALVIYTGNDTRLARNRKQSGNVKRGKTEDEVNFLSKILFCSLMGLSILMIMPDLIQHPNWFILVSLTRFMILFSSIIPISMRVNLDIAKMVYAFFINRDKDIAGAEVRNSTLPEELGRVDFVLSDKTGTLTKNEMTFQVLCMQSETIRSTNFDDIKDDIRECLQSNEEKVLFKKKKNPKFIMRCVQAMALCHNVTPSFNENGEKYYQASSPDEVALVKFAESVGVVLEERTFKKIVLNMPMIGNVEYEILNVFPFSSSTKRMGIIVRNNKDNEIYLLMKGADNVMSKIIKDNEWLSEECNNLAREGLRTLVFGSRKMSQEEYQAFNERYDHANTLMTGREEEVLKVQESIEHGLNAMCITGVEDELQEDVQKTLEMLKQANVRVWMLTGDKVETATCIAKSTKLVDIDQEIIQFFANSIDEATSLIFNNEGSIGTKALIVDGNTLSLMLKEMSKEFIQFALKAQAVVCCRCLPSQKADIVRLVKSSGLTTCAIGDGGNDVSMIQEADVGLGIEGKEGKQASMAADFSIKQFSHMLKLLLWHGRNSYIRTSDLALFIMHRGMIISIMQAVFSMVFYFTPITLFTGILLVGYSTFYTMAPVFSLVLDERISLKDIMQFPVLYAEMQKGQNLSFKTFSAWMFISILQGSVIMMLAMILFDSSFVHIVSISFTVLILIELLNIGFTIRRWNWIIFASEASSVLMYLISIIVLRPTFEPSFVFSLGFWWRVAVITLINSFPFILKFIYELLNPPKHMTVGHKKFPISFDLTCCCNCHNIRKKNDYQDINFSEIYDKTETNDDSTKALIDHLN
ncbi:phospholipid-transporting P-type ATPase, putative [Entamoeba histolytica HM-1:IMSS-B]|uniref:Phospholipid-transporting ATPase n=7 Tax=Entamoeba histolytica TaxID=5759 RepID=A0A8U0WNX2_ENTH1|nr:phospholipid-transporting P-type ATPase, putative [Entamoeba histolytica HM-1:IMSS]EMD49463.1 phospholipid-transporting P-type ATPase, putative [Entamoeba histolytica KU27]EMH77983.1 phospholipid-transporting P-type ATPase, putative [Entamoeba histolytica HM-1:IMSS-B]EMS12784.1 phospholipid-transporting P-type ATPase, putative [Entamoeba histolytica HM-3:IMSS]ENY64132.1 phospholipid-transporting P-type ATPase, putative [Entamoeba histolytica HM-1:IMSS-A]CAB45102.1 cation transporting ATPase|eukprot:XP_650935.1 phospholipid-transporting P-type ATPase, putative [Entamoeba histolytica HM-1:IMSS]